METRNKKNILGLGLFIVGALLFFFNRNGSQDMTSDKAHSKHNSESHSTDTIESNASHDSKNTSNDTSRVTSTFSNIQLSSTDQKQLKTISEILASRNDNDPRINTELKNLSPDLKIALMEKYKTFKPEQRNEKGMMAFLVSRDLKSVEDLELLKVVFEEPSCLSLADCSKASVDQDPHLVSTENMTLVYPQMATLYQIEQKLKSGSIQDSKFRQDIRNYLSKAASHEVPTIKNKAQSLLDQYKF